MKFLAALFAIVSMLALAVVGALTFLLFTEGGQSFVASQTQAAVSRIVGPAYRVEIGPHTATVRADGTLAVEWDGVRLQRLDRADAPSSIEHLALALRLRPLLTGSLALSALEIDGARIDLAAFGRTDTLPAEPAPAPTTSMIARTVTSGVSVLERQLEALQALQFDTVSFSRIAVDGVPRIAGGNADVLVHSAELTRDGDGALAFDARFNVGRVPLTVAGEAAFTADGGLSDMGLRAEPIDIGRFLPPGPVDDLLDERPFAADVEAGFSLSVEREVPGAPLLSRIELRAGAGHVQVGRNHTQLEALELSLTHSSQEDRLVIERSPIRFAGVSFDAEGVVEPDQDADGAAIANRLRFRLGSPEVRSTIGGLEGEPPATASVLAEGTFSAVRKRIDLEKLSVDTGKGMLLGSGIARYGSPIARTRMEFSAQSLAAGDVKAFWPFNAGGGARRWVLGHVGSEGFVRDARISLDLSAARRIAAFAPDGALRASELRIDLNVDGGAVQLPGDLPRLTDLSGGVSTRGVTTTVDLADGTIAGPYAVDLKPSQVTITRPPEAPIGTTGVKIALDASGPAAELLAIADAQPIGALRAVPFSLAGTAGSVSARANADLWFGLGLDGGRSLRDWSVDAELLDVTPPDPIEGQKFANLTGPISVKPGSVSGEVSGSFNALNAQVALAIPFGAAPVGDNRVEIDVSLDESELQTLVPALDGLTSGRTTAKILRANGTLSTRIDLTDTAIAVPALAWRKGRGVRALVDANIARDGTTTRLNDLRIDGDGFSAAGSATLGEGGLRQLEFRRLALNPDDDISLRLDRSGDELSLDVRGESFDARPLIETLKSATGDGGGGPTLSVFARIDRVRGFEGRVMTGLDLSYASNDGRLAAVALQGRFGGNAVNADLSPRANGRAVTLRTSDLGSILAFAGVYKSMEGGAGTLELVGDTAGGYSGRIQTRDFTLVDEPRLSSLVGTSSGGASSLSDAVGRDLRTSRAFFDQAAANVAYRNGRLSVGNGILRGPIFGSSFEGVIRDEAGRIDISGSFMPAYGINRLFGSIPLVGQILGNGNEGGLLGITYRLSGAFASPSLTVNPLSIVAPGIFRQIFEY